jgi:hypothetical protein
MSTWDFFVQKDRSCPAQNMVDRIFDLYDDLEKQRIMLSFKGDLSMDLITALLGLVERKMDVLESDHRMRKRVFNVVMECLQNLFHHNGRRAGGDGKATEGSGPHGVVMVAQDETGYSILTGNCMAQQAVDQLKEHLDLVNGCEPEQLRDLYRSTLSNGKFSRGGGGGLGIIDIARKSGQKLEYGFVPLDNGNTFFSLNVNVTS